MAVSKRGYHPKPRNTGTRERKSIVLLCTEGKNKTETFYFRKYPTKTCVVRFAPGNYTDPINMVHALQAAYEDIGLDPELGDAAYCLIDADFDPAKDRKITSADSLAGTGIEVVVSAPCFEVWYLCHFTDSTHRFLSNAEVLSALKKYIPEYRKEMPDVLQRIDDKRQTAIKNAKILEKHCYDKSLVKHTVSFSPSTEIYKVIEKLDH